MLSTDKFPTFELYMNNHHYYHDSNSSIASKNVKLKPFDVEHYLARLTVLPCFASKDHPILKYGWFAVAFVCCWTGAFRFFTLSFVHGDSRTAYYLGDFTGPFGNARDYLAMLTGIWSLTTGIAMFHSFRIYLHDPQRQWAEHFREFNQSFMIFRSHKSREIFVLLHRIVKIACLFGSMISGFSSLLAGAIFVACVSLYREGHYVLTIGLMWLPQGMIFTISISSYVLFLPMLFTILCYYYISQVDEMCGKLIDSSRQLKNSHQILQLARDYVALRRELEMQNRFWKRTSATLFLGITVGLCFEMYIIFFAQASILIRLGLAFFGLVAFGFSTILQSFMAAKVRSRIRRMYGPAQKLVIQDMRISSKFHLAHILEDASVFEPFSCFDMFVYDYKLIFDVILELIAHLFLLVSLKYTPST